MTHPPMGSPADDPRAMAAAGQPSEEDLRAYLEQLREADAGALVAEAYNLLAAGAQVKLGRPDARTLIDAMDALTKVAAPTLPSDIGSQMQQGVQQLQVAQVQAEAAAKTEGEQADGGEDAEAAPSPAPGQRMTDRLWVPGRDPGPPAR